MIMRWTNGAAAIAAGMLLAGSSFAQQGGSAKASAADTKFVMEAAQGGMEEVQLGKIAAQKGASDQVKQFGQKMVDDHSKANDELKSIASTNGITLPTELDAEHKAMVDHYNAMAAGPDFDRMYVQDMVKDHQKDVSDFQTEASSGTNPDIKGFASKTLPTLQQHLKMIQDAQSSISKTSSK